MVVRERDLDPALLPGLGADQLALEALDEASRAELEHEAARLAALEGLPVERAGEVEREEVALLGLAVDVLERGHRLAQLVELLGDLGLGHLRLATADLDPLEVAELGVGTDPDVKAEAERPALFRQVGELHLGLADGRDLSRGDRVLVPAGESVAERLLEHRWTADALHHDLRGHLPLAEARRLEVLAERHGGVLERMLDRARLDLDLHAHARVGQVSPLGAERPRHRRATIAARRRRARPRGCSGRRRRTSAWRASRRADRSRR